MNEFRILIVDELDIGTAALAALVLRARLAKWSEIEVGTAGVRALDGSGMHEHFRAFAVKLRHNPALHAAHQLTANHVQPADLVLTATRDARRAVALLVPRVTRRLFTLREFARTARSLSSRDLYEAAGTGDVVDRTRLIIESVAQHRGVVPPLDDPADDDIIEPRGVHPRAFFETGELIAATSNAIADVFELAIAARR